MKTIITLIIAAFIAISFANANANPNPKPNPKPFAKIVVIKKQTYISTKNPTSIMVRGKITTALLKTDKNLLLIDICSRNEGIVRTGMRKGKKMILIAEKSIPLETLATILHEASFLTKNPGLSLKDFTGPVTLSQNEIPLLFD